MTISLFPFLLENPPMYLFLFSFKIMVPFD